MKKRRSIQELIAALKTLHLEEDELTAELEVAIREQTAHGASTRQEEEEATLNVENCIQERHTGRVSPKETAFGSLTG
jgi:hypothetical protein